MDKVWLVTTGSYSDFHVVGVFSSKKKARALLDTLKGGSIREYTLDPFIAELNEGLNIYHVEMKPDGEVITVREEAAGSWSYDLALLGTDEPLRKWYSDTKRKDIVLDKTVFARDAMHAVKIVNEMRVQWLAKR